MPLKYAWQLHWCSARADVLRATRPGTRTRVACRSKSHGADATFLLVLRPRLYSVAVNLFWGSMGLPWLCWQKSGDGESTNLLHRGNEPSIAHLANNHSERKHNSESVQNCSHCARYICLGELKSERSLLARRRISVRASSTRPKQKLFFVDFFLRKKIHDFVRSPNLSECLVHGTG